MGKALGKWTSQRRRDDQNAGDDDSSRERLCEVKEAALGDIGDAGTQCEQDGSEHENRRYSLVSDHASDRCPIGPQQGANQCRTETQQHQGAVKDH